MPQAGAFLALATVDDPMSKNMFFSGVDSARFKKPISPGDTIKLHMSMVKRKLNLCRFEGQAFVDDVMVTKAIITANIVDRAGI